MSSDVFKVDLLLKDGDIVIGSNNDFVYISGRDNVKQAIINRLKTVMGWYSDYPIYGSRLNLIAGEPKTDTTLNLIKFYARECLMQEERIEEIKKIDAEWVDARSIKLSIDVKLVNEPEILHLVVVYGVG